MVDFWASSSAEYRRQFSRDPVVVARAPGRVNLIGEHTDYNDGFVLPFAISRNTVVAAGPGSRGRITVHSATLGDTAEFPVEVDTPARSQRWQNYVRGVVAGLRTRGVTLESACLHVSGNLAAGSGLSSSAALCVAAARALIGLAEAEVAPLEVARLAQRAEHDFAGTPCGIMDQYVSLFGRRDSALLIDCRSTTHEYVPLHVGGLQFVIVHSGVKHQLSSGAYEQRVRECRAAVAAFREATGTPLAALRDVTPRMLDRYAAGLDPLVARRARHVVSENQRVHDAAAALRAGRMEEVGCLLFAGHRSLCDNYEVSCPEIEELIELISGQEGVLGARMVGGGFGGAILVIAEPDTVPTLTSAIARNYNPRHARPAEVSTVQPADGAECRRIRPG